MYIYVYSSLAFSNSMLFTKVNVYYSAQIAMIHGNQLWHVFSTLAYIKYYSIIQMMDWGSQTWKKVHSHSGQLSLLLGCLVEKLASSLMFLAAGTCHYSSYLQVSANHILSCCIWISTIGRNSLIKYLQVLLQKGSFRESTRKYSPVL